MRATEQIRSAEGPCFDCYMAIPDSEEPVPAVVLASSIFGVDTDLLEMADEFASWGYIAAAPDLFWRTDPGPMERADPRAVSRAQPRLEKIKRGEQDLKDVLQALRNLRSFNGRAAVVGICYGGPYAILGPKRLGYDAGLSFHGTQLRDFISDLEGVWQPVCVIWGDRDHAAPGDVRDAYRAVAARLANVEIHVFPGVQHGYMTPGNKTAFDKGVRDFSVRRALSVLHGLRRPAR